MTTADNDMLTLDLVASLTSLRLQDAGFTPAIIPAFVAVLLRGYTDATNKDPAALCRMIAGEFDKAAAKARGAVVTTIRPATDGKGN